MKHYGDVSKISGLQIELVDIITFGSPCQDMSVAGKREGMKHSEQGDEETTRSGLFYEAIRIIKEMRESANGEYPKYAVWENVPGAFSSNKGHDFHAVLKRSAPSVTMPYQSLNLMTASEQSLFGTKQERSWETIIQSPGEHLMRNTGESRNVARESTLSQILQADAPEKYYLSPIAGFGILRRAEKRGKVLPLMLWEALMELIEMEA